MDAITRVIYRRVIMCDDYEEEDPYDYCYECGGYGDDYYMDEDGELVCRCPECLMNPNYDYWEE